MLLGVLPLSQHVRLDDGRSVFVDVGSLESGPTSRGRVTPVLRRHDPGAVVGWCDKVKFSRSQDKAYLYGELDPGLPGARGVAHLVRTHVMDGLSPGVKVRRGERHYSASGRWGDGNVVSFAELSVVVEPRIREARWERLRSRLHGGADGGTLGSCPEVADLASCSGPPALTAGGVAQTRATLNDG